MTDCPCEKDEVECVTYTSSYVAFIGLKTKLIDLSVDVAASTISITICADGSTSIAYQSRFP